MQLLKIFFFFDLAIELPPLPMPPYLPINCTGTDFSMDAPIFPQNDTDATCPATEACFCECSVNEDCPSNVCYKPPGPINPMTGIPIEAPGICAGNYDYPYAAFQ